MTQVRETIEVDAPITTTYNQWTQFEQFPSFMEGIERVIQVDDRTLRWTARIAGRDRSWLAQITRQVPDQVISWVATEGARNDGTVTFERLGTNRTRVNVALDVEPEGPLEQAGAAIGVVGARVKGDLERFRDIIEERGEETGAWRGTIRPDGSAPQVSDDRTMSVPAGHDTARADGNPGTRTGRGSGVVATPMGAGFGVETDHGLGAPATRPSLPGAGFGLATEPPDHSEDPAWRDEDELAGHDSVAGPGSRQLPLEQAYHADTRGRTARLHGAVEADPVEAGEPVARPLSGSGMPRTPGWPDPDAR